MGAALLTIDEMKLQLLRSRADHARIRFLTHNDLGSATTPEESIAWQMEHKAYELLLEAARYLLAAEIEHQKLASEHK